MSKLDKWAQNLILAAWLWQERVSPKEAKFEASLAGNSTRW